MYPDTFSATTTASLNLVAIAAADDATPDAADIALPAPEELPIQDEEIGEGMRRPTVDDLEVTE